MTVVLPDPATLTTSSTGRPEVAIPTTAARCPAVSRAPKADSVRESARSVAAGVTRAAARFSTPLCTARSMAASVASTEAVA
jgi:hypothetical protein